MEPIRTAALRAIEAMLDEWAEISASLPDTPARRELNARAVRLEEMLLHWDGCPIDVIDILTDGGLEVPESMLDEEEAKPQLFAEANGVPLGRTLRSITGKYCAICGGPMHGEHHVDPGDDADHAAVADHA